MPHSVHSRPFKWGQIGSCHSTAQSPPVTLSHSDPTTACESRVVCPWSSPDSPWLLGPHWFPCLSWNMPNMLLPLQFVNPFLVLFFLKYDTLTLFFPRALLSVTLSNCSMQNDKHSVHPDPAGMLYPPLACFFSEAVFTIWHIYLLVYWLSSPSSPPTAASRC